MQMAGPHGPSGTWYLKLGVADPSGRSWPSDGKESVRLFSVIGNVDLAILRDTIVFIDDTS